MIQDTSFVVDLLRGDRNAMDRLDAIEAEARPEKVAAVTVLELYEGVVRSQHAAGKREQILDVLDSKAIVPADQEIMRRAGRLSGELHNEGSPIEREDCVVAATALQEDEPVLTRNVTHFERISGLDVETY